jgi:hypothetical protein
MGKGARPCEQISAAACALAACISFWGAAARAEHGWGGRLFARVSEGARRVTVPEDLPAEPRESKNRDEEAASSRMLLWSPWLSISERRLLPDGYLAVPRLRAPALDALGYIARTLGHVGSLTPPVAGPDANEIFHRRVYDFNRKCFNSCPLGGWSGCTVESRAQQDECQGIAGRTVISAAARRAPLVREFLRLVGSKATAAPTDPRRGVTVAAALVRGGGTLGIEASW